MGHYVLRVCLWVTNKSPCIVNNLKLGENCVQLWRETENINVGLEMKDIWFFSAKPENTLFWDACFEVTKNEIFWKRLGDDKEKITEERFQKTWPVPHYLKRTFRVFIQQTPAVIYFDFVMKINWFPFGDRKWIIF